MILIGLVAFLVLGVVWLLALLGLAVVLLKHLDARRGRERRALVVTLGLLLLVVAAAPLVLLLAPAGSYPG